MTRSRGPETSMRKLLGQCLYDRALARAEGKPDALIRFDESTPLDAGTPGTPKEPRFFRPRWMIVASFIHGKHQTAVKKRDVHVSPVQAFALLSKYFQGLDQKAVSNLALNLISIVKEKGLLAGYSSACVATACVLAAQAALHARLLDEEGVVMAGMVPNAVLSACAELKEHSFQKLALLKAITAAKGDVMSFPGNPLFGSKPARELVKSPLTIRLEQISARGSSGLRHVENAADISHPTIDFGDQLRRIAGYLTLDVYDDLSFEEEDDFDEGVALPDFEEDLAYGHGRRSDVAELGFALGNFVI